MSKSVERCPHCGAKVVQYTHSLRSGRLVGILCRFVLLSCKGRGNPGKMALTKNEYNNFQKLRYWGVVEQAHADGAWRITEKGAHFLNNEIALPVLAVTYRGRLVEHRGDPIRIDSFLFSSKLTQLYQKTKDYRRSAQENKQMEIQEILQV